MGGAGTINRACFAIHTLLRGKPADLDVDTKWLKEFGVIASKDSLTVEQFYPDARPFGAIDLQPCPMIHIAI